MIYLLIPAWPIIGVALAFLDYRVINNIGNPDKKSIIASMLAGPFLVLCVLESILNPSDTLIELKNIKKRIKQLEENTK